MKRLLTVSICLVLTGLFAVFAAASGSSNSGSKSSSASESSVPEKAEASKVDENTLGKYSIVIDSCRLAEDFEGNPVVIVKYVFTNNNDTPTAFNLAVADDVFQDGIGLNDSFFLADSADYSSDNKTKKIKKGSTLEVESAYALNDLTTDITVEVSELISFSDKKVTRTFSIAP